MKKAVLKEKEKMLSKNHSVKIYKKVLSGKLKKFPQGYWSTNTSDLKYNACMCVKYMAEVVLKWGESEYCKLTKSHLKRYSLDIMLKELFNDNVFELVDYMYPGVYYEWTFLGKTGGYWTKEKLIWATCCVFEKNKWSKDFICKNYNYKLFRDNGLEYAVKKIYHNKIYELLEDIFKDEGIELWEMNNVPRGYWTNETGIRATIWMIERLGWNEEDIKSKLTKSVFKEMGLEGMLRTVYKNSPFNAINSAYPGLYKRYDFKVPKGYWTKETVIEAIINMVNDLGYGKEDVSRKLTRQDFKKYRLDYPIQKIFDGSYYDAINAAYPGVYGRYELKHFRYREIKMNKIAEYISYYE